uniref:PRKR interacting protein 1 n=1 Tax=Pongo abelii TaxID=9601 RepID=A0A8I5TLJ9_PONAB
MASPAASSVRPPRPKKEPQTLVIPKNAAEEQKLKLERLMKNPDKAVPIPEKMSEWAPRPPPEFVRDVMGSSAGAGSGEFHVYRHLRRREYQRQDYMDAMAEKDPVSPRSRGPAALRRHLEQKRRRKCPVSPWGDDNVCHSLCLEPGSCYDQKGKAAVWLFLPRKDPLTRWMESQGDPSQAARSPAFGRVGSLRGHLPDTQRHCLADAISVPGKRGQRASPCHIFEQ